MAVAIASGLLLTCIQTISVLGQLTVEWPDSFMAIIEFMRLFVFDMDLLKFDCVVPPNPINKFLSRQLAPVFLVAAALGALRRASMEIGVVSHPRHRARTRMTIQRPPGLSR